MFQFAVSWSLIRVVVISDDATTWVIDSFDKVTINDLPVVFLYLIKHGKENLWNGIVSDLYPEQVMN